MSLKLSHNTFHHIMHEMQKCITTMCRYLFLYTYNSGTNFITHLPQKYHIVSEHTSPNFAKHYDLEIERKISKALVVLPAKTSYITTPADIAQYQSRGCFLLFRRQLEAKSKITKYIRLLSILSLRCRIWNIYQVRIRETEADLQLDSFLTVVLSPRPCISSVRISHSIFSTLRL